MNLSIAMALIMAFCTGVNLSNALTNYRDGKALWKLSAIVSLFTLGIMFVNLYAGHLL